MQLMPTLLLITVNMPLSIWIGGKVRKNNLFLLRAGLLQRRAEALTIGEVCLSLILIDTVLAGLLYAFNFVNF